MYILITITILSHILTQECKGIHLIDLPDTDDDLNDRKELTRPLETQPPKMHQVKTTENDVRRWLMRQKSEATSPKYSSDKHVHYEDEKDESIKSKIATLVQQTLHDTDRKIKSVQYLKDRNRELAPYRAGFILSMIKKSRDVLNELFNVAVKHRDEWKALEQLKIFELIVHTNVDTTNLVRQMVEIHIQHLNSTNHSRTDKRKVVLL